MSRPAVNKVAPQTGLRPRDFVGYGQYPPKVRWPNDEKLVVNIVVNYEEGAEYSIAAGDRRNDGWGEYNYEIGPSVRDLGSETHYEFGSRVGIWRLARIFDEFEVPITVGACAVAVEQNPQVAQWIRDRDIDVLGHGYRWLEYNQLGIDLERAHLRLAIESLERTTGMRTIGWYLRSFPSEHTIELLAEDGGFLYSSDPCNDELPYYLDTKHGSQVLILPYSKVYNDTRYLLSPTYSTPDDFVTNVREGVDYICREVGAGTSPRMLTIGLHPRWSGQANRASAVRSIVEYLLGKDDVSIMRRVDIARWWDAHHQEWGTSRRG